MRGFRQFSAHLTKCHACHGILHLVATWHSPDNAIRKKAHNTTRLKCCACHAKWRWTRPKCCACHENCNSSCENVVKVLRLPPATKTIFTTRHETRLNVTKWHACHAKWSNATFETSKNDTFCRTYPYGHTAITRTVAEGCERLGNVERTHPQPPDPQSETGTLASIREKIWWNGRDQKVINKRYVDYTSDHTDGQTKTFSMARCFPEL